MTYPKQNRALKFSTAMVIASVFDVITCTDAVLNLTYRNAHNRLSGVPDDIPRDAVNIYLQDNHIDTIADYTFSHHGNCAQLRLDHNNLVRIKREMWTGLISLHWLNLSKNQIQNIEPESFIDLPELKGLYLSYNQLATLSQDVFPADGSHPERLTLHGNPLQPHDDEELCWLHQGALEGWISGVTLTKTTTTVTCETELTNISTTVQTTCFTQSQGQHQVTGEISEDTTDVIVAINTNRAVYVTSDEPSVSDGLLLWQIIVIIGEPVIVIVVVTVISVCFCRKWKRRGGRTPSETSSTKGSRGIALLSIEQSPEQSALDASDYLLPVNERSTSRTPARAESLDAEQSRASAHVYEEIDATTQN